MRFSLATKLSLCLFASAAIIFAAFGIVDLRLQRRHLEATVLDSADRISDLIQRSTLYAMLHNDRDAMFQTIREIGSEPGIRRVRIFNNEGRISFSTDPKETGMVVDKNAEACYACHRPGAPLTRLARPDRSRIFEADGQRVLAVIRPIENQASCWNAACHFHPRDQRVLGVIDAHLRLANADARYDQQRAQVAETTAAALALVCLVSMIFVWRLVHNPLRDLTGGMRRIARGNLDHRLVVRSRDELGEVAADFNRMAADLAAAREELTSWARTLEQRVDQKAAELERANRLMATSERMASLGRLAATVAHEVNNPLFGILNYARLTRRDVERADPPPANRERMLEQLQIIERESRRCGELMRNLLMFARQSPKRIQAASLREVIERSVALVRHRYELAGIALDEQTAADLPEVPCDANQIQQVVLGLLVNAAEAMPKGGTVQILTSLDAAARHAVIRVRDNGPGIPSEVLPQIFEPFFTTKQDEHRTGLGLAVARSIIEQHGGAITVVSAEGSGAEFAIRLPLGPALAVVSPQTMTVGAI